MNEELKISDFDIVGIIKLRDVKGIEKYVTPLLNERVHDKPIEFLSRSKEYYNVKTMTELSNEREELKQLLTRERTKRNFVILENMMNASAKVYYKKLEDYINNPSKLTKQYAQISRACLLEDTRNMVYLLEGKGLISVEKNLILPTGYENCAKRNIEMDNKALLYIFCKNLHIDGDKKQIQVATPGYGSIFIGPFLRVMWGYGFTNILKSKYINEVSGKTHSTDIEQCVSNKKIFDPSKKVVLIDDNIGTGTTMDEIKNQLKLKGIKCHKSGAVQYNWRNYYKVTTGEKTDIDKFNIENFEIISPFNYAGHKLYSHAIDILHESGNEYIEYLNSKSYRIDLCNDLIGAIQRGIIAAKDSGVIISNKQGTNRTVSSKKDACKYTYLPQNQMEWIDSLIEATKNVDKPNKDVLYTRENI